MKFSSPFGLKFRSHSVVCSRLEVYPADSPGIFLWTIRIGVRLVRVRLTRQAVTIRLLSAQRCDKLPIAHARRATPAALPRIALSRAGTD